MAIIQSEGSRQDWVLLINIFLINFQFPEEKEEKKEKKMRWKSNRRGKRLLLRRKRRQKNKVAIEERIKERTRIMQRSEFILLTKYREIIRRELSERQK